MNELAVPTAQASLIDQFKERLNNMTWPVIGITAAVSVAEGYFAYKTRKSHKVVSTILTITTVLSAISAVWGAKARLSNG